MKKKKRSNRSKPAKRSKWAFIAGITMPFICAIIFFVFLYIFAITVGM